MTSSGPKSFRKILQNRKHDLVKGEKETLFRCRGWKGDINGFPHRARPADFIQVDGTGVEGSAILMYRNVENIRIVPINILGPVAMVAIGIHNRDF